MMQSLAVDGTGNMRKKGLKSFETASWITSNGLKDKVNSAFKKKKKGKPATLK